MKRTKYIFLLLVPAAMIVSCKKSSFVQANINPSTLTTLDPGNQFLAAASHASNDFEYYYDIYRAIMPWMQYTTGSGGNAPSFTNVSGNFDYRYGNFYNNVGVPLTDIPHLIDKMTPDAAAARVYENAIASIYKAYYAFYVSDINGSIPYTQAFQARYGGTLTPVYDAQKDLFDTLDTQIKGAVAMLESTPSATQVLYGAYDPFYGDADPLNAGTPSATQETLNWIKAGNALRLKIAMRMLKQNPSQVTATAQEVLADPNQMASIGDSWVFFAGPSFATQGSNYNPTGFLASETMVNYMLSTGDPRLPIYYRQNAAGNYVGCPTNPDITSPSSYQGHFAGNDSAFSAVQHRLFTPDFDEGDGNGVGSGTTFFPYITYGEYCFIRAYLGASGITSDDAATWYNNGVTASIQFYDAMAVGTGIAGYKTVTAAQISNYLGTSAVTYSAATGLQQIACQAYLDFYRQPQEAWAWWKMTGYPNTTSVVPWSVLTTGGTPLVLPRRAALNVLPPSDPNYKNQQAAFAQMETDPGFGTPDNAGGRVWWDAP